MKAASELSDEEKQPPEEPERPWIDCPCECGNMWCTKHEKHAFECDCPET